MFNHLIHLNVIYLNISIVSVANDAQLQSWTMAVHVSTASHRKIIQNQMTGLDK